MPNPTKGTAALFSCKGGERAFETEKLRHGVFFYHVNQALKCEAKDKRGNVTWDRLTAHVRAEVGDYAGEQIGKGARQTPHLMANVEGDPVLIPPSEVKVVNRLSENRVDEQAGSCVSRYRRRSHWHFPRPHLLFPRTLLSPPFARGRVTRTLKIEVSTP